MVVNPSNADVVTFVSTVSDYRAIGVASWEDQAIVAKNADVFKTSGSGFTKINVYDYGAPLVDGAAKQELA
jgi:arabinogalactan endo-1,4-beta-galactosidase